MNFIKKLPLKFNSIIDVKFFCILKKKKNNFFVTIIKANGSDVLFSKSCGSVPGIRGSKKFTTVALESLGRETFLKIFSYGFRDFDMDLILRFKINKFVKSFIRGFLVYGDKYVNLNLKVQLLNLNSGLRAKKQRRV
jgi:hypothetical protein